MKKTLMIITAVAMVAVSFLGCTAKDNDELDAKTEAKSLVAEWDNGVYSNEHIGLYMKIPNTWSAEIMSADEIEAILNDVYLNDFGGKEDVSEEMEGIKIASAYRDKESSSGEYVEIFVEPSKTTDVEQYMQKNVTAFEELIAGMDEEHQLMMQMSNLTQIDVEGGKMYAVGIAANFTNYSLYQMNYGYYSNGYMIVISFYFESQKTTIINEILDSIVIS